MSRRLGYPVYSENNGSPTDPRRPGGVPASRVVTRANPSMVSSGNGTPTYSAPLDSYGDASPESPVRNCTRRHCPNTSRNTDISDSGYCPYHCCPSCGAEKSSNMHKCSVCDYAVRNQISTTQHEPGMRQEPSPAPNTMDEFRVQYRDLEDVQSVAARALSPRQFQGARQPSPQASSIQADLVVRLEEDKRRADESVASLKALQAESHRAATRAEEATLLVERSTSQAEAALAENRRLKIALETAVSRAEAAEQAVAAHERYGSDADRKLREVMEQLQARQVALDEALAAKARVSTQLLQHQADVQTAAHVHQLENELQQLKLQRADADAQINRLRSIESDSAARLAHSDAEVSKLRVAMQQLGEAEAAANDKLAHTLQEKQTYMEKGAHLSAEIAQLKAQAEKQRLQLETVLHSLHDAEEQIKDESARTELAEHKSAELETQLGLKERDIVVAQERLAEFEGRAMLARQETRMAQQRLGELESRVVSMSTASENEEDDVARCGSVTQAHARTIETLNAKVDHLEGRLDEAVNRAAGEAGRADALDKELASSLLALRAAEDRIADLEEDAREASASLDRNRVMELEEELRVQCESVNALGKELAAITAAADEAHNRVAELQTQLGASSSPENSPKASSLPNTEQLQREADLQHHISWLQSQLATSKEAAEGVAHDLIDKDEQIAELRHDLSEAQRTVQQLEHTVRSAEPAEDLQWVVRERDERIAELEKATIALQQSSDAAIRRAEGAYQTIRHTVEDIEDRYEVLAERVEDCENRSKQQYGSPLNRRSSDASESEQSPRNRSSIEEELMRVTMELSALRQQHSASTLREADYEARVIEAQQQQATSVALTEQHWSARVAHLEQQLHALQQDTANAEAGEPTPLAVRLAVCTASTSDEDLVTVPVSVVRELTDTLAVVDQYVAAGSKTWTQEEMRLWFQANTGPMESRPMLGQLPTRVVDRKDWFEKRGSWPRFFRPWDSHYFVFIRTPAPMVYFFKSDSSTARCRGALLARGCQVSPLKDGFNGQKNVLQISTIIPEAVNKDEGSTYLLAFKSVNIMQEWFSIFKWSATRPATRSAQIQSSVSQQHAALSIAMGTPVPPTPSTPSMAREAWA